MDFEHKDIGTRREVYFELADRTKTGMRKNDLAKNKSGKIVSLKASLAAKRRYETNPKIKQAFKVQQARLRK
jgi:hypothetical protein